MAQVIQFQAAAMPLLQQAAQKISEKYGGMRADETNWMVHCPLHDDKQASCHIQVTDKLLAYCHVCGKDKQKDLIAKLKEDDLWVTVEGSPKKDAPEVPQSNIPAHAVPEVFPARISDKGSSHPVTKIWTYHTETGHPAFWILRADYVNAAGLPGKSVMPFSSYSIDGKDVFKLGLQCSSRPLYNLPAIVNDPYKPILLVEGEKAADAAIKMFPDLTPTTWAGGVNGIRNTNISHLINRTVVMWPDNDQPGIDAMMGIGLLLPKALIVFQEVQTKLPLKWDLADPIAMRIEDLRQFIDGAKPPVQVDKSKSPDLEAMKERWQKVEESGGTSYYDTHSRSYTRRAEQPFKMFSSRLRLQEAEPKFEYVMEGDKLRKKLIIDKYIEDPTQQYAVGLIFDPTTKDVRVKKGESLYLNTFMGIENEPRECDPNLYAPFLDHIRGALDEEPAAWLLNFFADIFQNIVRKPGVMPILTGKPGTGKSIIGEVITCMLGRRIAACIPCGAVFDTKFNGMLANKIFVSFDELNLYGASNKNANENLKTMVTDPFISVNEKYVKQTAERSYHRFMATTNISMPVYVDMSDRRYAVFTVNDRYIGNVAHFDKIGEMMRDPTALSGLSHFFKTREIKSSIHHIPQTEARRLIQKPEDPILGLIFTWLNDASLPEEIQSRLTKCEWPEKSVFIPRHLVNDYVTKKHPSLAGLRPTTKMLEHFKWDRADGKLHNTKRETIYTADKRGQEEVNKAVYQLKPIYEQRKIYEEATGTRPAWMEITFDVDKPKENVVEFKEKDKSGPTWKNGQQDELF